MYINLGPNSLNTNGVATIAGTKDPIKDTIFVFDTKMWVVRVTLNYLQ